MLESREIATDHVGVDARLLLPVRFGKYILVERLAHGGMAEVFRAILTGPKRFQKTVAVKRILPALDRSPDFRERFIEEASVAADLTHSNIVQLLDFGEIDGDSYLTMELVDGEDAENLIRHAARDGEDLLLAGAYIVAEAARGLDYAHMASRDGQPLGLVHRDVSPGNILISRTGEVKVGDFGIVKVRAAYHRGVTSSGAVLGKLRYMSPEQAAGVELDGRSDVFALGLVLYELLTGERPLAASNPAAVVDRLRTCDFPPPSVFDPRIPPEIDAIVAKALARHRDERYSRASHLARDLDRFLRSPRGHGYGREDLAQLMTRLDPEGGQHTPRRIGKTSTNLTAVVNLQMLADQTRDQFPSPFGVGAAKDEGPTREHELTPTEKEGPPPPLALLPAPSPSQWGSRELTPVLLLTPKMKKETPKRLGWPTLAEAAAVAALVTLWVVGNGRPAALASAVARAMPVMPVAPLVMPLPPPPPPPPAPAPIVGAAAAAPVAARPARLLDGVPVVLERDDPAAFASPSEIRRARSLFAQGTRSLASGDRAAAMRSFMRALEVYPGTVAAYRGLAQAYEADGNLELALSMLETYLRAAPDASDAADARRRARRLREAQ